MFRRLFTIVAALAVALLPVAAVAQTGTGTITGVVKRLVGRRDPGRDRPGRQREHRRGRRGGQRRAGGVSRRRAGARPVPPGSACWTDSKRRCAGWCSKRARPPTIDVTLTPGAVHPGGGRDRPARRGSGPGGADSGVGGERRPRRRRRRLQREPPEGADPDRPVLFDQSAQLGDQHPRPRRAVRPHQRRHRAGRRPLHRRRLLRPSGLGDARLPRRRAVEVLRGPQGTLFGKNTTAGAINVTTRKPSFTPETDFELNYGNLGFVQAKASITGPLVQEGRRARCRSPARSATACSTTSATQDDVNDLNNLGVRGQLLFAPSDKIAITVAGRPHAPAARRLHAGGRRRRADAAHRRTGSTRRSPPTSATRRRASTPSTG